MMNNDTSTLKRILQQCHTIAVVGLSADTSRPSFEVARYLQLHGYRIVPVNPRYAGTPILGETCYATLADIPFAVDMVDVFRREEEMLPIAEQAIAIGAKCLWQQLGIANLQADALAHAAGLDAVCNRCTKIDHARLMKDATLPTGVLLQTRDARGVVTLALNRPQAFNALNEALLAALQEALDRLAADDTVRVVVLAAQGKAFCAGHDLKEMRAAPSLAYYEKLFGQCSQMMLAIRRLPVPVIARVQGMATAAGCQLVAMCDLAVAADSARFATSGVNYGLFCATPAVALSRNLGRKAAFEMLVTGDFITAQQAQAQGLINRAVPDDQLDAEVEQLIHSMLAKPRVALAMGKALFYRQLEAGVEAAYADAQQTMACNMMDPAALEGVQAFIEKRPPRF
ncbi:enoyl-CoA hydratase [Rhodoferax lacus]|uniref:Enoyl-CoA hydratase domain-containing protein 3, mitochondrial n=2 Tax=Rhodoferax lacus TaxID=2184758 RepID=A0A3E1RBL6_9BURK|nr:enoyl-CoA hydratase [Rhodoferax lacus]